MIASTAVWELQTVCCSCGSLAATPGCSSGFEPNPGVAFPGRRLQKFAVKKLKGKRHMRVAATRSLYSPLVESFRSTEQHFSYGLNSLSELDDSGSAWNAASSSAPASSRHHDQSGAVAYQMGEQDISSQLGPRDPLAASPYGDATIGEDIDMKRSARARPPTMSISQGVSSSRGRHSMSHAVGAVAHPVNTTKLPGPMGFAMAIAVAALGLKTAVEMQGFLPGTPQKVCQKCEGYGVQQCHVCQGRGVLSWEGKLRHTDPCPLCFGSCLKKCSSCGGMKMKKGRPPAIVTKLKVNAGSNRT